jgi:hypothetical protein
MRVITFQLFLCVHVSEHRQRHNQILNIKTFLILRDFLAEPFNLEAFRNIVIEYDRTMHRANHRNHWIANQAARATWPSRVWTLNDSPYLRRGCHLRETTTMKQRKLPSKRWGWTYLRASSRTKGSGLAMANKITLKYLAVHYIRSWHKYILWNVK